MTIKIEDQPNYDPKTDYTCADCGRFICRLAGVPEYKLCAECLMTPGWYRNPKLRDILDPTHDGKDFSI